MTGAMLISPPCGPLAPIVCVCVCGTCVCMGANVCMQTWFANTEELVSVCVRCMTVYKDLIEQMKTPRNN